MFLHFLNDYTKGVRQFYIHTKLALLTGSCNLEYKHPKMQFEIPLALLVLSALSLHNFLFFCKQIRK